MNTTKKRLLLAVVIIIFSVLVIFIGKAVFSSGTKIEVDSQNPVNKISVELQKVKSVETFSKISYKATVEPLDFGIVSSKTAGRVEQVLFENGDNFLKGDPMVVIDGQELRNQLKTAQIQLKATQNQLKVSQTNLQKLQVNLEMAHLNYDRTKELLDRDATSQTSFDSVNAALKVAKADLDSALLGIESIKIGIELNKITIDNLNDSLSNTVIGAPVSGIADEKNVNVGQYITINGGSTILGKVKDISSVNAIIQVEQNDLDFIKIGQKANIILNEAKEDVIEGIVDSIDTSANPLSRAFNCRIKIDNKNLVLHPGVFVKVELESENKRQMLMIPVSVLSGNEGSYSVYTAEQGVVHRRSVTIGEITKDEVEVLSGITADDSIVCSNINMLQDGDQITSAGQGE